MSTTAIKGGWFGGSAKAVAPSTLPPGYEYAPPASRMQGRPSRNALTAKGAKAKAAKPAAATHDTGERLLDRAIANGVINSGMRSHYATAFAVDPSGTRAFLSSLGLREERDEVHPTVQAPPTAQASDSYDESLLTPYERANLQAAREGRQGSRIIHGGL